MLSLVLLGVFGLLWAVVAGHRRHLGLADVSLRGAFVIAFLLFEALLAVVTESTSIGHNVTKWTVFVVWIVIFVLLLGWIVLDARHLARRKTNTPARHGAGRALIARTTTEEKVWLVVLLGIFGVLVFIGWVYPPSNGDSMVYHLARVAHWVQNRSVSGFATQYLAQIELAPLAEYNMLQLHVLSNTDRLDGYVQLLSAVVCVVGVSDIARQLGGNRRIQMAAAVLCATIPTGILEATSTENNFFAAAVAVALLGTLLSMRLDRRWVWAAVVLGCALGTAVMSKGTIPAYFGPVALLLGVLVVRRRIRAHDTSIALRRVAGTCVVAVACMLAVAGPFYGRNIALFGAPTGPVSKSTISTQLTARAATANIIRSTAANFFIGNGKSGFNTDVSKVALGFFRHLYSPLHVSQSDPRYLLGTPTNAFQVRDWDPFARSEDFGAAPWNILLFGITVVVLAVAVLRGRRKLRLPLLLAFGLACGYLLFNGTARWNVFQIRYQLPFLVASCAVVAVALGQFHRYVGRVVLAALVLACLPELLDSSERPLLHPEYDFTSYLQPYFLDGTLQSYQKATAAQYESVVQSVVQSTCPRVGLANWVLVEYPIWAGFRHENWKGTLEDVDVDNVSKVFESPRFHPCAWIREEAPGYVAADDGTVNLQYGQLALQVDARRAATIRTRVPGFVSHESGVVILPGGGWALAGGQASKLAGEGSVYLYSATNRQVELQLHEATSASNGSLTVRSPNSSMAAAADHSRTITVDLGIPAGMTRLRLSPQGPVGNGGAPLSISEVSVARVPAKTASVAR